MVWVSNAETVFNIDVRSQRLTHRDLPLESPVTSNIKKTYCTTNKHSLNIINYSISPMLKAASLLKTCFVQQGQILSFKLLH